jgi:hypothetical protein
MRKPFEALLIAILTVSSFALVRAQNGPTAATQTKDLKKLVVAARAKSDSEIAIPPSTSMSFPLIADKKAPGAGTVDLGSWLSKEAALNGLESVGLQPWHIVVSYDQFDEDGDNIHSGVYEEYWAGAKKFKRSYKSDDFNQTDYATDKGLYRRGDQQWPSRTQLQVRAEMIAPFWYGATLVKGFHARNMERIFSGYKFECVTIERNQGASDPTQYCFEPGGSVLRYNRGWGWDQTVYNRIESFQGRNIAREVDVTDGGHRYLELRVKTMEMLPQLDDAEFTPSADAVGPIGGRVSGVFLEPINNPTAPQWPASLRGQHFTVVVEMVIGKNGQVVSAHGVSGPPEAYKGCEDAVKQWVFPPYLVLGEPVEVEYKTGCSAF